MNKFFAVLVLLVLGGVGWLMYDRYGSLENAETENFTLSVSFMCQDETHFIAEFPEPNDVHIMVDGVLTRELPRVEGDGQRFEDDSFVYVFAGEEVSVTDKKAETTTTCTQPFDANNAPVNFGDAGEGGGVKQDRVLIVSESILGTWRSNEDEKFVRVFKSDGAAEDWYDNEVASSGSWRALTAESDIEVAFPLEADTVYIQMTMEGSQNEVRSFKLAQLTPETLEMIYMDRGGTLMFTRVQD